MFGCGVLKKAPPGPPRAVGSWMYGRDGEPPPRVPAPLALPLPSPMIEPSERKVLLDRLKLALTVERNGWNTAVSEPTAPRQRSCVRLSVKLGSRSLSSWFETVCVVHPERPGC